MTNNKQQVWRVSIDTRNEPNGAIHSGITLVDAISEEDAKKQAIEFMKSIGIEPVKVNFAKLHEPYIHETRDSNNNLAETEDNSIEAMVHQGKSIAQWEKDFNGEFTAEQLAKMARGSVDLQKLLYSDDLNEEDDQLLDAKEFFEEADKETNETEDEAAALNEKIITIENITSTVDNLYKLIDKSLSNYDTLMIFKTTGKNYWAAKKVYEENNDVIIDLYLSNTEYNEEIFNEKNFMTVSEFISEVNKITQNNKDKNIIFKTIQFNKTKLYTLSNKIKSEWYDNDTHLIIINLTPISNKGVKMNEATIRQPEDVVTVKDFIHLLREKTELDNKISFRANKKECFLVDVDSKNGIAIVDLTYGKDKMLENEEDMKESYSWRRGGYGGTGRSYSSLGDRAPRGAAIGWFNVDQIDPKAKGKMYGWRMGPSNFPFEDLLYPERKYKVGTTTMRNKYVKAGSMSGEKYIAIPSYFSAIKDNDQEAINLLNALGIPLDLTFGMDPNDDYSMTYTIKS